MYKNTWFHFNNQLLKYYRIQLANYDYKEQKHDEEYVSWIHKALNIVQSEDRIKGTKYSV